MGALRKADRRLLGWALAVWALVTVIGFIWAFPRVEDSLDESSRNVESFTSTQGAKLEWNGRDGYLTLLSGTPGAEQIQSDLANQSGPRDVETLFVKGDDPPTTETKAEPIPAAFSVSWDESGSKGDGYVPARSEANFNSLFGTGTSLTGSDNITMTDRTRSVLTDQLAPLIGTDLTSGRIIVDGDSITIAGVATDAETLSRLVDELNTTDGLTLNLTKPEPSAAKFNVAWDATGSTQEGDAPDDLSELIENLGVSSPIVAGGLSVGSKVGPTIDALTPLVGNDLVTGQLNVDGDSITIVGRAIDQIALDRATTALGGTGATLDLSISNTELAQRELDELLAMEKIEFVTNTDITTEATEGTIDLVADALNRFENIEISIVGFTDNRGTEKLNQALSLSRANSIHRGLVSRGIDESRLTVIGKGETEPIDSNETLDGRQHNRRVEIVPKESN